MLASLYILPQRGSCTSLHQAWLRRVSLGEWRHDSRDGCHEDVNPDSDLAFLPTARDEQQKAWLQIRPERTVSRTTCNQRLVSGSVAAAGFLCFFPFSNPFLSLHVGIGHHGLSNRCATTSDASNSDAAIHVRAIAESKPCVVGRSRRSRTRP